MSVDLKDMRLDILGAGEQAELRLYFRGDEGSCGVSIVFTHGVSKAKVAHELGRLAERCNQVEPG